MEYMRTGDEVVGVIFDTQEIQVDINQALGIDHARSFVRWYIQTLLSDMDYPIVVTYEPPEVHALKRLNVGDTNHIIDQHTTLLYTAVIRALSRGGYNGEELTVGHVDNNDALLIVYGKSGKLFPRGWT